MTPAQRAVLAKAKKDGLKPSGIASEFLLHDMVEACISQLRSYSVAWKNLGEKEQDASIASLTASLTDTVTDTIRLLMAAGASAIPFKLKSLTIDGKLKVTGHVEGDHPERHALTDKAHDKSEILLILSPRDYFEGMEDLKGEKDQKSLPLDSSEGVAKPEGKPAGKTKPAGGVKNVADIASAVSFKPADMDKARTFVEQFRLPTVAGVQQVLSCGFNKADAVLNELVRLGEVIKNEDASYQMPPLVGELVDEEQKHASVTIVHPSGEEITTHDGSDPFEGLDDKEDWTVKVDAPVDLKPAKPLTKAAQKKLDDAAAKQRALDEAAKVEEPGAATDAPTSFEWGDKLTDELYEKIKAKVIKDQKVSVGAISVAFDIPVTIADEAVDRLEMDTVISELDAEGNREVYDMA